MIEDKPVSVEKLNLPISNSPQKSQQHSQRKIDDEGSKWKSKSLNSNPTEHYEMDITKKAIIKSTPNPTPNKKSKQAPQQTKDKKAESGQKLLPHPKIKKINQKMFCITIDNLIKVFYMRTRSKTSNDKNSFQFLNYEVGANIEFTAGNGSNLIFIGTDNQLIVLEIEKKEDKYFLAERTRKPAPSLRAVTFVGEEMIVVSTDQVYQYSLRVENGKRNFDLMAKKAINFDKQKDEVFDSQKKKKLFTELKPINLVVESLTCFYFFGSKSELQKKIDFKSNRKFDLGQKPQQKMAQVLHIVKFKISHNTQNVQMTKGSNELIPTDTQPKSPRYMTQTQIVQSKISQITIQIFPIDHVFQIGIFDKSKIYQLDSNMFLMSLHEQIIIIKENFKRFIVWDNVSIMSSKSQEKKGQLILADKRILVYSENGEIFAHDIFFNEEQSRINLPPIDSFRGNDNDEEILYDAILLEYDKESLMKVLFYFKEIDVILPNKSKFRKQPDNPNEQQHDQNKLSFTMLCITQSEPLEKLKQMLRVKKPPNEIAEFCQRFGIKPLQKTMAQWSVSEKSLKDIENVLLQISDDNYIQLELDNILKKQPHNLTFLQSVQRKQIARLKKLIVRNLLHDSGTSTVQVISQAADPKQTEKKTREYVKKVIQWLMESIMFEKKLVYSKNFLSFKEYDFIEIGKLKAASLKEEIKLLSCKKYQKRLKYFLNSFKVLAIANWEEIFEFLLVNKNQLEIKQFLIDFSFILPKFVQTSAVFQKRNKFSLYPDVAKKKTELALRDNNRAEKVSSDDEKCFLWDDLTEVSNIIDETLKSLQQDKVAQAVTSNSQQGQKQQLNTVEDFQKMIIQSIKALNKDPKTQNQAIQNFNQLLGQVVRSKWFQTAAFKQHSMLNRSSKDLYDEFIQLKNKKAYQILVKYLYKQIQNGNTDITESGVNSMLDDFVTEERLRIPQSFKKNDDARLEVYNILMKQRMIGKTSFNMPKSKFLVMNEDVYFDTLFNQIRSEILRSVKIIYDRIQDGFFRERFEIFLKSKMINLQNIIKFMDEFEGVEADDVRLDVFNCIKRLLKLNDKENAYAFIFKSLDKEVFEQKSAEIENSSSADGNLRQQAKIPYGYVFYHFFKAFNLQYTYEQLVESTQISNLSSNKFLQQIIRKYCASQYYTDEGFNKNSQCLIQFEQNRIINEKLNPVDIANKPLEFFGILLYMIDIMDFQVEEKDLYELMIENYLNEGKAMEEKMWAQMQGKNPGSPQLMMFKAASTTGGFLNKFEELWTFVKTIDNYIISAEVLNSKTYPYIKDLQQTHDVQQLFVDYTINWINRKYSQIKKKQKIQPTLSAVKKVLQILSRSNKGTNNVKRVDAFYRLLQFLKKFNPQIMMKIDFIRQQQQEHSGFIFLIHMFRQMGVENFVNVNFEQPNRSQQRQDNILSMVNKRGQSTSFQTNTKIYNWMCIYSQYKIMRGEQNIQEKDNPEFIRFIVEICCIMIGEEKYEIAWDLLLRAVNQAYYFRDAFYYLASCLRIDSRQEFRDSFRSFLSTQTAKNLKSKLNTMIKGNMEQVGAPGKVISFPPQRLIKSGQSRQSKQSSQMKRSNSIFIFQQLLQTNRADQGFFFLVRIKHIRNSEIQRLCVESKRLSPLGLKSYLLLASYMKCLETYISQQFYPTFLFFKSKYQILIDNVERKDIIKDINIAISRLKFRLQEQKDELLKKDLNDSHDELYHYYEQYMIFIQEPVVIRLTQEDEQQATKRIQMYARITPQVIQEETKQQAVAKLKLQENQQKLQKVHENNKLNVIHKEIQQSVSQAKRAADKYAAILEQKKKQANKMTYAQKKQQELLDIKRKQEDEVSSIKDSFKSNTTQKVNELIEQLRKKREKINQSRYKSSMIREEEDRNSPIIPQKDVTSMKKIDMKDVPQSKYIVQVTSAGKGGNVLDMPQNYGIGGRASQIIQQAKKSYVGGSDNKQSQKYTQIQQKMRKLQQPTLSKVKVTLDEINDLFKQKQPQALKYLEKFDLIKQNMQVAVQLVKRVYSVVKDLSNFLQFLRYLLGSDERYKDILEEKSIAVVGQMIKMDQKINLKDLIPVELFTQVQIGVTVKDYYNSAYEILKPNLRKILSQEKIAAHALGILMRYSLGSQTKYFHRVFADYISVLLKNYETKAYDEKETFLLADKLRSQYTNLDPQNREFLFEKLMSEVTNESKKKKLLQAFKKALQRKTDSAIGGGQTQEMTRALMRLEKK